MAVRPGVRRQCWEQCDSHLCSWGEPIRRRTSLIKISYSSWRVCLIFEVVVTALSNLFLTHLLLTQDRGRWIVREHRLRGILLNLDFSLSFFFPFCVFSPYDWETWLWNEELRGVKRREREENESERDRTFSTEYVYTWIYLNSFAMKRCMRSLDDALAAYFLKNNEDKVEFFHFTRQLLKYNFIVEESEQT